MLFTHTMGVQTRTSRILRTPPPNSWPTTRARPSRYGYTTQITDSGGFFEAPAGGEAVTVAVGPNRPATGTPSIGDTALVGETLTTDISRNGDPDEMPNVSYRYQRDVIDGGADLDIPGATWANYTLVAADMDLSILVRVSFTDDGGNKETLTSTATDLVAEAPQPNGSATGTPAITGTARVGETLTADTSGIGDEDGLEDVTFS